MALEGSTEAAPVYDADSAFFERRPLRAARRSAMIPKTAGLNARPTCVPVTSKSFSASPVTQ